MLEKQASFVISVIQIDNFHISNLILKLYACIGVISL